MGKGFLYPFQGKRVPLTEVLLYYRDKGINIERGKISEVIKSIGMENITEEIFLDVIKTVLSQKTLATVGPDFKTNCINEFGQEFWDNLLRRKEKINESRKFRNSMKREASAQVMEPRKEESVIQREKFDGEIR